LLQGYIFVNRRKIRSLERGDMAKKFNRIAAKKNKKKAKSRFMDSIVLSENAPTSDQNNSEITADDSVASAPIASTNVSQVSSYNFLSKELIAIGTISGVLLVGLIVASLIV
tara:strand:+ start:523 stop:858 length:336 start_codon:yes stop_codon:yes gene_type:complete